MLKIFSLVLFTSILITNTYAFEYDPEITSKIEAISPSIVKIKVKKWDVKDLNQLLPIDTVGSGFVYDNEHHIITNAHVIKDAKEIVVSDSDDHEFPAQLFAKDEKTDIAILTVPTFFAKPLVHSSEILKSGELAFTIGSPYSLSHSVSIGIINNTNRVLFNYPYIQYIQTDIPIYPGNSGGPLLNKKGELIGQVSTYLTKDGSNKNIGFAIPLNDINRIVSMLLKNQNIKRGFIGAKLLISEKISRKFRQQYSIIILDVNNNGPLEKAGLQAGDIIIAINGDEFRDIGNLHRLLENTSPNKEMTLTYIRSNKTYSAKIILDREENFDTKEIQTNIGNKDLAEQMGIYLSEQNNVITILSTFSIAKSLGFKPNDRINKINDNKVENIKDVQQELLKVNENEISIIELIRDNKIIELPIISKKNFKGHITQD